MKNIDRLNNDGKVNLVGPNKSVSGMKKFVRLRYMKIIISIFHIHFHFSILSHQIDPFFNTVRKENVETFLSYRRELTSKLCMCHMQGFILN